MALQALVLPLVSIFRSTGFKEAMKAVNGLDGEFKKVAQSAGLAAASFSAASVLQSITQYVDEATVATQKYERNMLALTQIFTGQSSAMRQFTEDAQKMGISQGQAAQASVFLGSVLKQYGLGAEQTTKETQKLITLSQDLATTYGYDLQEALLAMTALFRGEYDPIEKFGVAMKQNEINALLAARGQDKLTGTMLFQAQVQARLDLLYQRSALSMGAFERAEGTLYVAQQRLNAAMENSQIAFGEPLQKPLAIFTDLVAKLVEYFTPLMKGLGETLGAITEFAGSTLTAVVDMTLGILDYLKQGGQAIIDFANIVNEATGGGQTQRQDPRQREIAELEARIGTLNAKIAEGTKENSQYEKELAKVTKQLNLVKYAAYDADTEFKRFRLQAERTNTAIEDSTGPFDSYAQGLKYLGLEALDAEGKLTGLAGVFPEIYDAIRKSKATDELDAMGFSASQIEYFLTKPDWAQIFGEISRLAKIAALDIAKVNPFGTEYFEILSAQNSLETLLKSELGKTGKSTAASAKKSVETIFDALSEETSKQRAKIQLEQRGASKGLIDLILGRDDWMQLWIQIKQGVVSLEDLQKAFNKTADGVKELEDAASQWTDYFKQVDALKEELDKTIAEIKKHFDDVRLSFADFIGDFSVLATVERQIGKFESATTAYLKQVKDSLKSAFRNKDLYQEAYNELVAYSEAELGTLTAIQRQRDELASRYSFAESLIKEYRSAFTSAMSLTTLFGKLSAETQKRTITEVSKGVVQLGADLRTFNVTVSKSYEETLTSVSDKSQGLLDGFRAMAEKARAFADNLKKLKDMGLDPMLFDQLVKAGVEAGGETAQALIDGGSSTITEVNSLFKEIDTLGGQLGFDVSQTYYDSGQVLIDSLLAGIKSEQTKLEELAVSMAESFSSSFQSKLDVSLNVVQNDQVEAAIKATNDAIAEIPVPSVPNPQIDQAALDTLNSMISKAGSYAKNIGDATMAAGALAKQSIYQQLADAVASGQKVDLSGIQSGLSTSELASRASAASGGTVNYNITVTADTRTGGAKAGEAVVQAINNFQSANGSFSAYLK